MNKICFLAAAVVVLLVLETSAFAMTFVDAEKVMSASVDLGGNRRVVRGQTLMRVMDLDGSELVFVVHNEGSYKTNYVTVESPDGATVYCTLPAGMRFRVHEIDTEDPEQRFWLARTGIGVSDDTCASFSLIGRYGDTYVEYVTLDDLRAAGLVGYEVWWKVEDGELIVQGWERNYGKEISRKGERHSQLDEVKLFWDEDAQWMGIRRESGSPFVEVEDTWFYTDGDGAEYYLRQTDMARSWIGGYAFKVDTDGETSCLLYKFEDFPNCPYSIYDGGDFAHLGPKIESGLLYAGAEANPSAVALYEKYLYQEMAEAVARRRATEERHRRESGAGTEG